MQQKFLSRLFSLVMAFALLLSAVALSVNSAQAQGPVEVRMLWYDDGKEGTYMRALLDKFEAANPDIKVKIDTVAFKDIHNILQTQVDGQQAPDIARITDLARFQGKYLDMTPTLKDAKAWAASFPTASLEWLRAPGGKDQGLYGFPSQFTVSGPFINTTLFEQAGVKIPTGDTTLEQWVELAKQVAKATNTPYAVAIDRSGHRIWGPALSMGASFIDPKTGKFTIDTPGFRKFAQMLIDWHKQGITPKEIWAGAGGAYASGKDFFENGQLVFYFSGNWQIGSFATDIGNKFDWQAVPEPCGVAACTGMPGGAAIVAMAGTKHPKETTRVMEYMSSDDVLGEFSAKSLFLPAQVHLTAKGVDFPSSKDALNIFVQDVPKLTAEAYALQGSPLATSVLNPEMRDRLSQAIVGELSLDDAIKAIQKRMDDECTKAPEKCLPPSVLAVSAMSATAAATASK